MLKSKATRVLDGWRFSTCMKEQNKESTEASKLCMPRGCMSALEIFRTEILSTEGPIAELEKVGRTGDEMRGATWGMERDVGEKKVIDMKLQPFATLVIVWPSNGNTRPQIEGSGRPCAHGIPQHASCSGRPNWRMFFA